MLLYKQGRFYTEGVSFLVPDGFYMETLAPVYFENGFMTRDTTKSHSYNWAAYPTEWRAKEELDKRVELDMRFIDPITPIQINGLSGYWLAFAGATECYEAQFDLPGHRLFMLLVDALGDSIRDIMTTSDFKAVLRGIRAEAM